MASLAHTVWNIERDKRRQNFTSWIAWEYKRVKTDAGHYVWRRVRQLGRSCPKWAATANGEESGLPRNESAKHNGPSWRLGDYVNKVVQATARLGGCKIALLARSNAHTWSTAICVKYPGERWAVVAHLGTRKTSPATIANALALRVVYAHTLPRLVGAHAQTREEFDAEVASAQRAATRKRNAPARRKKRAAKARAAGDHDKAAKILTGKSRRTRKSAAKKAAKTRKRKVRVKAKRSRAAQKAWKTRKENEEKRACRSEAAKRAWETRRKRECQS